MIAGVFSYIALRPGSSQDAAGENEKRTFCTVILDAGHGGEDGGAVSCTGSAEKDLNLDITLRLRDLLQANGVQVILTRETDILLYDRNTNYQGRKKALDLAARYRIAQENPDSIFVSIHMNSYPQAQYSGLQVWYSPNHTDSKAIADTIQQTIREHLQPENDRKTKSATSSIYLLHHISSPAVLVECGFLSNPEEAKRLDTEAYRDQLSFLLFLSIMKALE